MRIRILVLGILMTLPCAARAQANSGIPDRVSALEDLATQQQSQIDENSAKISDLRSWVALDANGNQVGDFMGFDGPYAMVRVEFDGSAGTLLLVRGGGVVPNATLWYPAASCRGRPLAVKDWGDHYFDDVLFVFAFGAPAHIAPYRVDTSLYPQYMVARSYVNGTGACRDLSRQNLYYFLEQEPLTHENLRDIYPAPIEVIRR